MTTVNRRRCRDPLPGRSIIVSGVLRSCAAALILSLASGTIVSAQSARDTTASDTTRPPHPPFTRRDALLLGGVTALTAATLPVDRYIASHLRNQAAPASGFVDRAGSGIELIATPGALIIGPAIYAVGRLGRQPGLADLGWHGTEAVLIGSGITRLLKGLFGRARPFVSADTNPHDFRLGSGFSAADRQSLPSAHATSAFAAATVVTSEVHRLWPRYTRVVAPVMYGGATLVGLSRMYHDKHWASDVVLGAGLGVFSGLKVVRWSHAHPDNFVDRVILSTVVAPDGWGGGIVGWTLPLHR